MKKRWFWICICVLLFLAVVVSAQTHRRHNIARSEIERLGFNYWHGFEEPPSTSAPIGIYAVASNIVARYLLSHDHSPIGTKTDGESL